MVIRDDDSNYPHKFSFAEELKAQPRLLASPLDRIAAFVIDHLIILGPIINLFLAPFERQMKEAILVGDDPRMLLSLSHAVLMAVSVILIYHSVFLRMVGASLGQILMGLRVTQYSDDQPLGVWNSVLRCLTWVANFLLLGLPSLAVFSDSQRRTWYDRVSDSIVITIRPKRATPAPRLFQRSIVQGFLAAIVIFLVSLVALVFYAEIKSYDRKTRIYAMLEEEDVLCGVVGEAQAEWPDERGKSASRVSVALALYLAGEVDLSCLEAEFDERSFASQQDDLARLAKSFIYKDHAELSDLYLNSVCDFNPKSDPCKIARGLLGSAPNFEEAEHLADGPVYLKIWSVKQDISSGRYVQASEALELIPKLPWTAGVRSVASTKLLWGGGQLEKSRGSAEVAFDFLTSKDRAELASWLCLAELSKDCESWDSSSCSVFQELVKNGEKLLKNVSASLAQVKKRRCEENGVLSTISIYRQELHPAVIQLVKAQSNDQRDDLLDMSKDTDLDVRVRSEALLYLLNRDPTNEEIEYAAEVYSEQKIPLMDAQLAPLLLSWAHETRDYKRVVAIGETEMKRSLPLAASILEKYIVAEYHLGRKIRAQELLQVYQKQFPESWFNSIAEERAPASVGSIDPEFSLVARSLK